MVNIANTAGGAATPRGAGRRASPRVRRVNHGKDTRLTFGDGSTILFKGVREVEAVFSDTGAVAGGGRPPIGGDIRGDA